MKKTVVIYDQLDAGLKFFVYNGDISHLNGVYINDISAKRKHENQLSGIVYDKDGRVKIDMYDEFPRSTRRSIRSGQPLFQCLDAAREASGGRTLEVAIWRGESGVASGIKNRCRVVEMQ